MDDKTIHTSRHNVIASCFGQRSVNKECRINNTYWTLTTEPWSKKTNEFNASDENTYEGKEE